MYLHCDKKIFCIFFLSLGSVVEYFLNNFKMEEIHNSTAFVLRDYSDIFGPISMFLILLERVHVVPQ